MTGDDLALIFSGIAAICFAATTIIQIIGYRNQSALHDQINSRMTQLLITTASAAAADAATKGYNEGLRAAFAAATTGKAAERE